MTAAQQRKDERVMNDLVIALGRGNCITCHVCLVCFFASTLASTVTYFYIYIATEATRPT